jgi:hypothetical protein
MMSNYHIQRQHQRDLEVNREHLHQFRDSRLKLLKIKMKKVKVV